MVLRRIILLTFISFSFILILLTIPQFTYADSLDINNVSLDSIKRFYDEDFVMTSWEHTVGDKEDRLLIVGCHSTYSAYADSKILSVSFADRQMQLIPNSSIEIDYESRIDFYYMPNPPLGNHEVSIKYSNSVIYGSFSSISFYNVDNENYPLMISNEAESATFMIYSNTSRPKFITLNLQETSSSEAKLGDLLINTGSLNPSFSPEVIYYDVTVKQDVLELELKPIKSNIFSNVYVNNEIYEDESQRIIIQLDEEITPVIIDVVSQDETNRIRYIVNIKKEAVLTPEEKIISLYEHLSPSFNDVNSELTLNFPNTNKIEIDNDLIKIINSTEYENIIINTADYNLIVNKGILESIIEKSFIINIEKDQLSIEEAQIISNINDLAVSENSNAYNINIYTIDNLGVEEPVEKLQNPLIIHIHDYIYSNELPERISMLEIKNNYAYKIPYTHNRVEGIFSFDISAPGRFSIVTFKKVFKDVDYTKENSIKLDQLAYKEVLHGVDHVPNYEPERSVTRSEFVKMIVQKAGILNEDAASDFSDLPETHWSYKYVSSAKEAGLIVGRPDGTFAPDEPISKQDISIILVKLYNLDTNNHSISIDQISDLGEISDYAVNYVKTAIEHNLLSVNTVGEFLPEDNVNRFYCAVDIVDHLPINIQAKIQNSESSIQNKT